jgi:hypothetical protein
MSFTPGRYYETLQVQNYQNLRHPSYEYNYGLDEKLISIIIKLRKG